MKILRITLSNIASLAGQHTVNFTQEPLQSAGLYAISGDTGSGKSSLLDAMCLALYGKTPRLKSQKNSLEKINDDEQQLDPRSLLRRGTAEGMAEVAFIGVDGKKWTARWAVRRARKNVSGKLQHVERTLFEGHIEPGGDGKTESGGKKTEVDAAIQQKLGLTFEQFTRAVLLAQNEFAVFLKSDDKARAEILQALTGTRRFEDVSKAVFERCRTERRLIDDLKTQLKGGSILPEEERQEKETQLATITKQLKEIQDQLKQLEAEQAWHAKLATHNDSLKITQAALNAATTALTASQPRKQQLQFTELALRQAAPLKQAMVDSADVLAKCIEDEKGALEKRAQLEAADKQIASKFDTAESGLKVAKLQVEQLHPKLIEAARLEENVRLKTEDLAKANAALADANKASKQATDQLEKITNQKEAANRQQRLLQQQQQEVQLYQPFVSSAELWIQRLKQAADTDKATQDLAEKLTTHQQRLSELQEQQNTAKAAAQNLQEGRKDAKQKLDQAENAASEFDRDELIEQRKSAEERRQLWDSFYTHVNAVSGHEKARRDCQLKLDQCTQLMAQQDAQLKQLAETDLPMIQQTVLTQEASLETVQAAISDEAVRLRTQLNDEQPCAVCGSQNHPYSAQPPTSDQAAVQALQNLLKQSANELQTVTQKQSLLEAERKANATLQQEYKTRHQQLTKELAAFTFADRDHSEISPLGKLNVDEQISEANRHKNEIVEQLGNLNAKEGQATAADKQVATARKAFEDAQQKEQEAQEIATTSEQTLATAATDEKNLQQRLGERQTQQKNEQLPLQELFSQIPESQIQFKSDAQAFRSSFSEAVELVANVTKQLSEIDAELKQLNDKLTTIQPIATTATSLTKTRTKEAHTIKAELTDLQNQLSAVFEGRTAEIVEQEISAAKDLAEKQREQSELARNQSQKALATASQQAIQATKQTKLSEEKAQQSSAALQTWRSEFNASNAQSISESDLDKILDRTEAWLKSEAEALQKLASDVQTKTGQLETLQEQHKVHLDGRPSEQTREQVQLQHQASTQQIETVLQSKEDVQKHLTVDDAQRKTNEDVQLKIVQQEKLASPWIRLNEVIGSSDGSAFRNIAQRHTLDILLQSSNLQLNLLSGRYRLARITNSLNLMVVDQDMADERRSIHSLSGGESFLVSLALALGLASLTSNRLKIESLFIDEGFGSLDPNTLDLAMNALMQLESQGRKVGIISHVTAMTDAIPVQIKVRKGANGASMIDVPTITQVVKKGPAVKTTPTQQSLFADPESET
ncbi:MAG: AAA family ATPase [Fuerstiella sp.]